MGRDSCVVNGLPIGETGDCIPVETAENVAPSSVDDDELTDKNAEVEVDKQNSPLPIVCVSQTADTPRNPKKRQFKCMNMNNSSANEKRELQCELMKLKIYKHKLEVLKLERELTLPPSEYTKEICE